MPAEAVHHLTVTSPQVHFFCGSSAGCHAPGAEPELCSRARELRRDKELIHCGDAGRGSRRSVRSVSSRAVSDAAPVCTEARVFSWASSAVADGYSRLRAVAVLGDWSWSTVEVLGHRRGVARVWSAGSSALAGGPPPSRGPPSAHISNQILSILLVLPSARAGGAARALARAPSIRRAALLRAPGACARARRERGARHRAPAAAGADARRARAGVRGCCWLRWVHRRLVPTVVAHLVLRGCTGGSSPQL